MVCPTCGTDYNLAAVFEKHARTCEVCRNAREDAEHLARLVADHYRTGDANPSEVTP
jgi:hypothetical protein